LQHLPEKLFPKINFTITTTGKTLKEIEKKSILQALQRNNWKKMVTARELGIDKNTLRRKIIRHEIEAKKSR